MAELGRRTKVPLFAVMVIAVLSFWAGQSLAPALHAAGAAPLQQKLSLGMSASEARKAVGIPAKISFDGQQQSWFYSRADGSVHKRFIINQGLVVQIF